MAGTQHDTKLQHLRVTSVRDLGTSCTGDQR
jgi:hypothetical protein